jgi:hypothetical protein
VAGGSIVTLLRRFCGGLMLAAVIAAAAILGDAEGVWTVDVYIAGIGLVIAGALALGVNLGNPIAVRSLDDYGHTADSSSAAARLAVGCAGLYVGAIVTALIVG